MPQADEFSSCKDLMSNSILRMFLWFLGILALIGNLNSSLQFMTSPTLSRFLQKLLKINKEEEVSQ